VGNSTYDEVVLTTKGPTGEGTKSLTFTLEGILNLEPTIKPVYASKGSIYYDKNDNILYCWNGNLWKALY